MAALRVTTAAGLIRPSSASTASCLLQIDAGPGIEFDRLDLRPAVTSAETRCIASSGNAAEASAFGGFPRRSFMASSPRSIRRRWRRDTT